MDKQEIQMLPYIAFETMIAQQEREKRRLVIALIVAVVVGFLTTAAVHLGWMYLWNQYDYESSTETRVYTQDGQGVNIINGAYGTGSNNNPEEAQTETQGAE